MTNYFPSVRKSVQRIKNNPHLWYTIIIAILIVFAFGFVASRFIGIAQDAQERLVNVRIGALQSSFVEFATDYFEEDSGLRELNTKINKIAISNSTIREFKVVEFDNNGNPEVIASLNKSDIGGYDDENSFIYGISKIDNNSSYTLEINYSGDRAFQTVRSIKDETGAVVGAVLTTQSLSDADIAISNSIQNSVYIFIVIVILIMFLFFRHSKIIDYSTLYRKIKEADQMKDDFISMASHELRTPLTVIRGYTESLSESGEMNEMQKKSADRIEASAKQLDNLVNDMLDVSRLDQGRLDMNTEKLNPVEHVKENITGFMKVAEDKGLKLEYVNEIENDITILADADKFRQVIVNLVGNAIKYAKEGDVNVRTSIVKGNFVLRVSDSGIGMSAEEQKGLFKKFHRIKNEETQEIRGTGLGLWITKRIIELMGGKVSVESIKGVGTHFIVTFPQA